MEQPLVTVICLCYNQKRFAVETLQSVLNQTYQPIELIVVDDCSPDKSAEIIETFLENKPILFIKNTVNQGSTKSFNLALKHAKGEFVMDLVDMDYGFEFPKASCQAITPPLRLSTFLKPLASKSP